MILNEDFVFPSDADRAENEQLNYVCEVLEEVFEVINDVQTVNERMKLFCFLFNKGYMLGKQSEDKKLPNDLTTDNFTQVEELVEQFFKHYE